ncbi:MAG: Modification methylase DpnIIB [Verrucomicrobia subdivision 3 bacterium]|nr:Modification methylase DpnIIB [Limisphaerales bacterium]MCS1415942.1 Modification methylase DpnIIB [Limisphaerales bacterium]
MPAKKRTKTIETLTHGEASRKNIPSAEHQPVLSADEGAPIHVAYARRNRDLDPQLVWRGKDEQNATDLMVKAPPLFIQERVHPKALIDDLKQASAAEDEPEQVDLFADFNGLPEAEKTEFYQHDAHWTNRMILGDSLQVMASLAEREGLRGKVQCIYIDPPYGIKFNSNFQWSTTSRDVKDGKAEHITREPEQVKAFRDTWRNGVHSYLTYLRDRLTVARDLLTESGSVFVQIGDENVHRVRALMDEVFGEENFFSLITVRKTGGLGSAGLTGISDFVVWYAKSIDSVKYRNLLQHKVNMGTASQYSYALLSSGETISASKLTTAQSDAKIFQPTAVHTMFAGVQSCLYPTFQANGKTFRLPVNRQWSTTLPNMMRVGKAGRLYTGGSTPRFIRFLDDHPVTELNNLWTDVMGAQDVIYVVQTNPRIVQRCLLMTTDPGDLVLDPTCGSGTTAYVAEQWGRRWVTIDTSRVALALARARIMGARYPYYLLSDSLGGQKKEAELTRTATSGTPTYGRIRQGFVYERVPHITLKSIANNAEIDVIWEKFQETLEPLRARLNAAMGTHWEEWEVPRDADESWPQPAIDAHKQWWEQRIARQKEIDASIAAKADYEFLYDKPFDDKKIVRVAGPFTVESLSPHRTPGVGEDGELIDGIHDARGVHHDGRYEFGDTVLKHLEYAGVQQAHKEDKIDFTSLAPYPGEAICAEGRYTEGVDDEAEERRAGIFIGPEFGTVSRADLVEAAREAAEAAFDVLISCAFSYDAQASDLAKLGRVAILKARMNADLHMADDLKNTGKGNLFVVFGEPDFDVLDADDDELQVKINGVDVFHPQTGEVRSDGPEGIACWFIDTNYNEESFFVRHAYFLGANDPYKSLKTTLKAEINADAWETLHSDTSRPFPKPETGRIAVKVINHLGDEVMKVFRV